jgi:hypothetical protein
MDSAMEINNIFNSVAPIKSIETMLKYASGGIRGEISYGEPKKAKDVGNACDIIMKIILGNIRIPDVTMDQIDQYVTLIVQAYNMPPADQTAVTGSENHVSRIRNYRSALINLRTVYSERAGDQLTETIRMKHRFLAAYLDVLGKSAIEDAFALYKRSPKVEGVVNTEPFVREIQHKSPPVELYTISLVRLVNTCGYYAHPDENIYTLMRELTNKIVLTICSKIKPESKTAKPKDPNAPAAPKKAGAKRSGKGAAKQQAVAPESSFGGVAPQTPEDDKYNYDQTGSVPTLPPVNGVSTTLHSMPGVTRKPTSPSLVP